MRKSVRAALVTTGLGLMAFGAALQARSLAKLRARNPAAAPTIRPRVYAHVFGNTAESETSETESLQQALRNQGIPIEPDWPNEFTFGRGGGPESGVLLVPFGIAVTLTSWYMRGFIGSIGADHAKAIKETIGAWLAQKKADEFYVCILSGTRQQVRATFPADPASFWEAWDALDLALMKLPELAPNSNCLLEWDSAEHRWTLPL